jgi:response regulator RpfG family c-di-GMP phosphodiesterase
MSAAEKAKILCVDDEPRVLEGLALHLGRIFEMVTAASGREGLEILAGQGPFTVVLSDMRMPGMDGAAFLSKVRQAAPDTTRMLLTGDTDLQAAIAAVNEGQIFRFLTKPCAPYNLRLAFEAAAVQYRLVTAERVLLEQTVHGAVKTLTDILALTSPLAFGRAARVRQYVHELAGELQLANRWQIEVAAMLSQLGSITIPEETFRKHYCGEALSADEKAMIGRMPAVTEELLANIPRLEPVRAILARHTGLSRPGGNSGGAKDAEIAAAAGILRIAVEFDELESRGLSVQLALDTVRGREGAYDPAILQAFVRLRGSAAASQQVREIPLRSLGVGMVLAEDMRTNTGLLLVTRGFEVTPSFLEKTWNHRKGYVKEPLLVIVRAPKE